MVANKKIIKVKVEADDADEGKRTAKKPAAKIPKTRQKTASKPKTAGKTAKKIVRLEKTEKITGAKAKKTDSKTSDSQIFGGDGPVLGQKIAVVDEDNSRTEDKGNKSQAKKEIEKKAAAVTAVLDRTNDPVKIAIAEAGEKATVPAAVIAKDSREKSQNLPDSSLPSGGFQKTDQDLPAKPFRSVAIYRRIAFTFIALTLALIAVAGYFLLIKVTIVIVPNQERVRNSLIFDVKDPGEINAGGNIVPGLVEKSGFSLDAAYPATGEEVIGKEAVGEAVITNNYNRNQPLVATTRLLAAGGELFRLKNTVNVPAGESITVEIYADEPSPEMAIGPTKFTIPGLWAGLQDQVYAETKEAIVYQQKVEKYILETDLENAIRDLKQKLLLQAKEDIASRYKEYDQVKYKIDENSIKTDIKAKTGDKTEEFGAAITADIVIVAFDGKAAADLAKQKFIASLSPNKEVIEFDDAEIVYALDNYDYLAKEAAISATFEGKVSWRDNAKVIDAEKIKGLSQAQLDTYLEQIKDIAGYEIVFQPSFLPDFLRRVPKLSDRIEIIIKKE